MRKLTPEEEQQLEDCLFENSDEVELRELIAKLRQPDPLVKYLRGILEIGKRDVSNPKYDGYFESAKEAVTAYEAKRSDKGSESFRQLLIEKGYS